MVPTSQGSSTSYSKTMVSKKTTLFVLSLFFSSSLLFSEALDDSKPNPSLNILSYDYFEFALLWPPSVCSNLTVECVTSYEKRFLLSSFKPLSYYIHLFCWGPAFDIGKIKDIEAPLSKVWYDLVYDNNTNIWKQAWDKDGVCSSGNFDQTDYFELALNIKNNRDYNVLDIVQSVGITPKESNPLWRRSRFYNAIYWRLGKKPILRCNTNKYTKKTQLSGVGLCFAKDGIQLIDCPHQGNCPEYFTWPTTASPPPPPPPRATILSINNQ